MENTQEKGQQAEGQNKPSPFIMDFCDHLRKGTSVLQKKSKNPSYIVNAENNTYYLGYNMLVANQGMFDAGVKSHLVLSSNQMEDHVNAKGYKDPIRPLKGTKAIGTVLFPIKDAYYTEFSPQVVEGKAKAGDVKLKKDGTPYRTIQPYILYAVPLCQKTKRIVEMDQNGQPKLRAEHNLSKDQFYSSDKTVTNPKTGETFQVKKGDPVILNFKGTQIVDYKGTGEKLTQYQEPKLEPIIKNQMVPLYQRKDDSPKEVLMENLTKFFRGCMNGGFEGCKFTTKEIDDIEKAFVHNATKFRGICNSALTRAYGDERAVARMDEYVNKKEQSQIQSNSKTESEEKTASKGKSR